MSCPQPTAQYGHTPWKAFASRIFSEVAAASTGERSMPAPTATPAAVLVPSLMKSRRDRLMADPPDDIDGDRDEARVRELPLGTRELFPDGADHDDTIGAIAGGLDLDDVPRIEAVEVVAGAVLVAHHHGLV